MRTWIKGFKPKKTDVLFFTADWCPPCGALKKKIAQAMLKDPSLSVAFDSIVLVNVDEFPAVAEKNGVQSIPVFVRGKKLVSPTVKELLAFLNGSAR